MDFKVGQKYRIVDIDAWWDKEAYPNEYTGETKNFNNGDIVCVGYDNWKRFCFITDNASSQQIYDLCENDKWHDSCIELITDEESDQPDGTISLCHIADVLEDALNGYNRITKDNYEELSDKIWICVESLRKAGY